MMASLRLEPRYSETSTLTTQIDAFYLTLADTSQSHSSQSQTSNTPDSPHHARAPNARRRWAGLKSDSLSLPPPVRATLFRSFTLQSCVLPKLNRTQGQLLG